MNSWFDKDKNWFNRHLWWAWTLGNLVVVFLGLLPLFFYNSTDIPFWVDIWWVVWWAFGIIFLMLYIEIVHLKQKGRSLWYLPFTFMLFLGMGIIMSLKEKVDEKLL